VRQERKKGGKLQRRGRVLPLQKVKKFTAGDKKTSLQNSKREEILAAKVVRNQ